MNTQQVLIAVQKVAPAESVDSTGLIAYDGTETPEQVAAAEGIVANWVDPPVPDYEAYAMALVVSPGYMRITSHNLQTVGLKSTLEGQVTLQSEGKDRRQNIKGLWDAIAAIAAPTPPEITALNTLGAAHNIDQVWTIAVDGTMTLT